MTGENGFLPVAALELVQRRYWVFPCRARAKTPANQHGYKEATDDAKSVKQIWEENPRANIGVACGASGIAVFDIDSKSGADPSKVIAELGDRLPPNPVIVQTGVAGPPDKRHPSSLEGVRGAQIWFRGSIETTPAQIKGCEFRGAGAYVMAPPSIHPSGVAYQGDVPPVDQVPELPDQIAALKVEVPQSEGGRLAPLPEVILETTRHKTFHDYALSMRRKGFTEAGIAAALKAENHRCVDVDGKPCPLPEEDIEAIARDKAKRFEPVASARTDTDRTHRTLREKPHEGAEESVRSPTEHPPNTSGSGARIIDP